jgi:hypothetical protein
VNVTFYVTHVPPLPTTVLLAEVTESMHRPATVLFLNMKITPLRIVLTVLQAA